MSDDSKSCTLRIKNSEDIEVRNIHSDANQVISLDNVKHFTAGDIYHFTKDKEEVNRVFEIINNNIYFLKLPEDIQMQALKHSKNVQDSYLSKDGKAFRDSYQAFTGFLSNHVTLYTFLYPICSSLINNLLG
ncbi:hypothetical protein HCY45_04500 [Acinetobacter radioresistens]|uniref:hypothetical protein n=1 Tax=Acinetobacter radioresistens TaxID=40216 RepID=UPI0020051F7C|nr:hypothetical protein [Acinetobacter radioresistens]MCK4098438.1 hypothetical protein [Acinetobacter radioresistens]